MFCFDKDTVIAKNSENEAIKGLSTMNDFQIFMALVNERNEKLLIDKKILVLSILTLFFPNYVV